MASLVFWVDVLEIVLVFFAGVEDVFIALEVEVAFEVEVVLAPPPIQPLATTAKPKIKTKNSAAIAFLIF